MKKLVLISIIILLLVTSALLTSNASANESKASSANPTTFSFQKAPCNCTGKKLKCKDFKKIKLAQQCFEYCKLKGYGDIFKLDPDKNGKACDTKPKKCHKSYPDICIAAPPPDLDCKDIPYHDFRVLPPDPHRFDGDHDGVGCETW